LEFVLNLFLDTLNKIIIFGLECCVMGEEDKKEEYKIKAGEFGFFKAEDDKDLDYKDLINKGKITVLTGKNGCGKTQILKYIAKKHANETIFNTTEFEKSENKNRFGKDYKEYKAETSSDFVNEILLETRLKNKTELTNALFKRNDSLYKEHREDTIKRIVDRIKKYKGENVANDFLHCFGKITDEEEKMWVVKDRVYRKDCEKNHIGPKQFNFSPKLKREFNDWWEENKEKEEIKNTVNKTKEEYITESYSRNIFNNFYDFTRKLNSDLFNEIDINNLIKELADDIFLDYKEKRKVELSKWASINTELEEQNHYFNYKLVEPDKNLQEYIMEFEYIGVDDDLKNHGVVHFDSLSTGEKKIFTLIVYKYLLTIAENKTKYKYLLLDEFDANLNPALINFYVETLAKISKGNTELCIIITTHSSSTLLSFKEKYSLLYNKTNDAKLYVLKKDITTKKNEIEKIKEEEFNNFFEDYADTLFLIKEISDKDKLKKSKHVIVVEGKGDKEYLNKYLDQNKINLDKKDFYFHTLGSKDNIGDREQFDKARIKNALNTLKQENSVKDKTVFFLFDSDDGGYEYYKGAYKGDVREEHKFSFDIKNSSFDTLNTICKNIIFMRHTPIKEDDFKKNYTEKYPYSYNMNEVVDKIKTEFEIEDLIVAYNVDKYKKFLEKNKQYSFDIKKFFSIDRGNTCKESVKSFFGEKPKAEDFNFAGFDELFKRIEANFKV
jgi:energy-coupling factor transporter ATP-binding protein EcfA2